MRHIPGGRLVIAWGPGVHKGRWTRLAFETFWKSGPTHTPIKTFHDFHSAAVPDDDDPFASVYFGRVVKELLSGFLVVLTDPAFEDRQRRRAVERAFKFAFPEWSVSHVQLGGNVAPPQGIVIDDDVYRARGGFSNEHVVVETSDAPQVVLVAALQAAAQRMMRVDDDGREHDVAEDELGAANYVSEVTIDTWGRPGFYIDCKGGIEPPIADRFRAILVEELKRREVVSAILGMP